MELIEKEQLHQRHPNMLILHILRKSADQFLPFCCRDESLRT
jgi:hypothetical protein